ncbi:hypothetical protein [Rahnella sp. PD12R]|uniref:hypothetical protein n=1 Tax=Rahnella sp. PD12R TaxID=2855688 RepID=UPI00210645A3|nr:hypothetical protein [Rahnella sp. PD12R]
MHLVQGDIHPEFFQKINTDVCINQVEAFVKNLRDFMPRATQLICFEFCQFRQAVFVVYPDFILHCLSFSCWESFIPEFFEKNLSAEFFCRFSSMTRFSIFLVAIFLEDELNPYLYSRATLFELLMAYLNVINNG